MLRHLKIAMILTAKVCLNTMALNPRAQCTAGFLIQQLNIHHAQSKKRNIKKTT